MTEEEKKAIEDLKEEIKSLEKAKIEFSNEIEDKSWLRKNINELDKDIFYKNTILNLIEKLQKENEELKEDNLGIREENIKLVNCHISYERYTGLDFLLPDKFKYAIPKDKIKEKIKELEQQKDLFFEKTIIQGRIDLLKELLEEE